MGVFFSPASLFLLFSLFFVAYRDPKNLSRYGYYGGVILLSLMGMVLAIRHIWLQHLPPEKVPACTAGLERLLSIKPFFEAFKTILMSGGECAKVDFRFFSLSIPLWTLLIFFSFAAFGVLLWFLQKKRRIL